MSELLFLVIGLVAGWLLTFHAFYSDLKTMSAKEIREALDEMQELERQWDMARQAQDDEEEEELDPCMTLEPIKLDTSTSHLDKVMSSPYTHK
jgi:hypothetical protein